jgi:hypothetical protein
MAAGDHRGRQAGCAADAPRRTLLASGFVRKTSADLFYRIASALLFGVALALIWQGAGRLPR